ncbi:cell division protein SepF [Selenomonas bovis]|uniref:Cell division protein SepF n=1 Tax=Selenomonas bovis TaxID=416586 RepID=A0A848B2D3_9FIRM|nr:cell division protein SepF [Selenomonas bovis]MCI6170935.1 cell division protein SepF [Selenomonas bovis]MCI7057123.1 cell division protein SepF [Selenomonas bovis]NMD98360.1 cell division protein SepF [Selenomonas bovis]
MKIIDKVCGKIGLIDSDEEKKLEEEIEQEEQEVEEEDEEEVSKFERSEGQPEVSARNVVDFTSAASARENGGNLRMKVIVIEPKTFDDAQQVANCLREKRPVVINFENTDGDDARRIIDFISGTTYALNGEIKKVGHNVFFCAPSNVNVTYTEEERKVSTEMPWLKK